MIHSLCFTPNTNRNPSPLPLPRAHLATRPPAVAILKTPETTTTLHHHHHDRDENKDHLHHHHHLQQQLLPDLPTHVREKILCLEIMGVDSTRALSLNPTLRTATLDSVHAVVSFLRSKGIHHRDLPRIFGMCPGVLTADPRADLAPVFRFLSDDLRVPDTTGFRRAVNKCPRLLVSSVRDQLRPALLYLRRLGFDDTESLAYHDPVLLVSSVERTLAPKLEYLQSGLGFACDEAVAMVQRCPALFTFSVENNFKPKFAYLVGEMGATREELRDFPQYFAFSLEKRIKPRHREMVASGVWLPLPAMLKTTDKEFRRELLLLVAAGRRTCQCDIIVLNN